MERLGIEFATVLGAPPVAFVRLAAALGCRTISSMLSGSYINPYSYPNFDLRTDAAMKREMIAAMRDLDVAIALGEGFVVTPDQDVTALAPDLDLMRELGVKRVNVVSMDPSIERTFDQFAVLVERATAAGIDEIVTEFAPVLTVTDLPTALRALHHVDKPNFRLVIDTMHFGRTGGTAAELAALAPDLIGYVQLCDVPVVPVEPDYMQEAMCGRLSPGDGELPLADLLAALPRDRVVSLEVPQLARARAGATPEDLLRPIVAAGRALLAEVDG